ncbi:MAG TPA: FAD-binding oxidoreductase [Solirubrobacteraceae bacterium]|nr:FAD-binding oxidoreductase [Solirubrobacteraceae bacterium]
MARRFKHWGWGYEDQQPIALDLSSHLGFPVRGELEAPATPRLPPVRVAVPPELAAISSAAGHDRAVHALGKSFSDVVRGLRGDFEHAPDFVARPREEADVERVLQWCEAQRVAVIPFGGGTSVAGGVTPAVGARWNGTVSLDTRALSALLEVDPVSRSACIGAGACGPALEAALAEHGLTLRHFPQSFEYSTLGGWIATRAGGHFATLWTHIEDLVESVRAITPRGQWESRRLPGSGAGVSPDRMLVGSEGILGVITSAWVRVQPRPAFRASATVLFERFLDGADAVRAIGQSGLHPANCRLIDAAEARLNLAGDGSRALLVLGMESTDHPVDAALSRALELCAEHGGARSDGTGAGGDAAGAWREMFLRMPYLRDSMVAMGVICETFETAITWERFPAFLHAVMGATRAVVTDVTGCPDAHVSCRFTHVYPDGPAPYFTVLAPGRRGEELEQWATIKRAAADAILAGGGTITHHHAVGRDHRPWYDAQRPEPFALALRGAKAAVDPAGILNPGVLL